MLRVTLLLEEEFLKNIPLDHVRSVEVTTVGSYQPLGDVIYKKGPAGQGLVDIEATLTRHNASREEILSRRWPYGTWQQTVKRAMAR